MIRAVLFNLDGLIVDTAKYHYQAWNRLANTFGYEISEEDHTGLQGHSRKEYLDHLLEYAGVEKTKDEKEAMAEQKNKWYREYMTKLRRDDIMPGIESLLDELQDREIKIGLGSSSRNSLDILKALDLESYFDTIIDGHRCPVTKPDPEVFIMAAVELGIPPSECLVIDSSVNGIKAARAGGFPCIGVGDKDALRIADAVTPTLFLKHYSRLLTLLHNQEEE